jgi:hypothetical protein
MEPTLMLQTSAALFAITALGGIVMALIRFSGKPHPPSWLAMLHGLLAAAGLTLLLYAALAASVPRLAMLAVLLFLASAIGGVVMNLQYHLKAIPLPKWLVLVHAVVAVAAFACLLIAAMTR